MSLIKIMLFWTHTLIFAPVYRARMYQEIATEHERSSSTDNDKLLPRVILNVRSQGQGTRIPVASPSPWLPIFFLSMMSFDAEKFLVKCNRYFSSFPLRSTIRHHIQQSFLYHLVMNPFHWTVVCRPHPATPILNTAAFSLQRPWWAVAAEILGTAEPYLFTILTFTKKVSCLSFTVFSTIHLELVWEYAVRWWRFFYVPLLFL